VSLRATILSVAFVAAVALPGVRSLLEREPGDGFPLSTYPMFDEDPGRVVEMPTVVLETGDRVERLSPRQIAGTDQVIQAWEAVKAAVAGGPAAAGALCAEVAGRLHRPGEVAVVVERHDVVDWSSHPDAAPLDRRTIARCRAQG
jgi:hypothetical protein